MCKLIELNVKLKTPKKYCLKRKILLFFLGMEILHSKLKFSLFIICKNNYICIKKKIKNPGDHLVRSNGVGDLEYLCLEKYQTF